MEERNGHYCGHFVAIVRPRVLGDFDTCMSFAGDELCLFFFVVYKDGQARYFFGLIFAALTVYLPASSTKPGMLICIWLGPVCVAKHNSLHVVRYAIDDPLP